MSDLALDKAMATFTRKGTVADLYKMSKKKPSQSSARSTSRASGAHGSAAWRNELSIARDHQWMKDMLHKHAQEAVGHRLAEVHHDREAMKLRSASFRKLNEDDDECGLMWC